MARRPAPINKCNYPRVTVILPNITLIARLLEQMSTVTTVLLLHKNILIDQTDNFRIFISNHYN